MLFHLVGTEQLRSQRRLVVGVLLCQAISADARPQMEQGPANSLTAHLQCLGFLLCSEVSTIQIATWAAVVDCRLAQLKKRLNPRMGLSTLRQHAPYVHYRTESGSSSQPRWHVGRGVKLSGFGNFQLRDKP